MNGKDTDFTEWTEHTFDDWQKEWETAHPILHKIDLLFKEKSLCGYRASHTITHPWIFLQEGWRQIRWAWQRVFTGYDERVIWSIDLYLAKMLPKWMRKLKREKAGVPMMAFYKEDLRDPSGNIPDSAVELARMCYDDVLEEIAVGFDTYKENKDSENAEFIKAFELFRTWFGTFWD